MSEALGGKLEGFVRISLKYNQIATNAQHLSRRSMVFGWEK